MITTGCDGCCFLKQDNKDKGCNLGQLSVIKEDKVFAPGYCRLCRSSKWAKKKHTNDIHTLHGEVLTENYLRFDLLVIFDEATNNISDLEKTLNSYWYTGYVKKIIIVDVTGFGNRKNIALQYIKSMKHDDLVMVDSSVVNETVDMREETIYRVSKQVTSPFFMVIPAGKKLIEFYKFAEFIQTTPSRVIHWSFPFVLGATVVIPNKLCYGLFITIPYRALTKFPNTEKFTEQLRKEELETEMGLSWMCSDWLLI